jgi:hypothetical protein
MSHSYPDFRKPFIINEKKYGICDSVQSNVLATRLDGDPVGDSGPGILVMVSAAVGLASPGWDNVP